jgi:alginate O-acetyltransferase complex protein AlgI
MVFSSSIFLFYFLPIFLLVYYLVSPAYKNVVALIFSLFFYAWGAPDFIYLVGISLVIDFYIVRQISRSADNRKLFLWLSVLLNIGMLGYFKYANFFVDNFNEILNAFGMKQAGWLEVALPIGISFFTFQKLSYTIDIYRGTSRPLQKLTDYAMYIMLFPQLIAGPIVRYNEIATQIVDRSAYENNDNRLRGMFRFCIGLSKKLLIADTLGIKVDEIFLMNPTLLSTEIIWIGIIAYSFQIYYDFSGYSDMAIGIGRMLGFKFPENFNNPYVSRNITEFWRRWHMTLSRWMRDYLYIPLGGSRVDTKMRLYFNLWIVFLLSGLWHGAAWNFVIWGAFHGLFLVLDRLFLIRFFDKIGKFPSVILTYIITLVGWVIFRANSADQAMILIKKMFSFTSSESFVYFSDKFWVFLIIGFLFAFLTLFKFGRNIEKWVFERNHRKFELIPVMLILIGLLFLSALHISVGGYNPFIYFRF